MNKRDAVARAISAACDGQGSDAGWTAYLYVADAAMAAMSAGLVPVGKVLLGDTDGAEIDDWDVEWERTEVDAINETRPPSVTKLALFMERPNALVQASGEQTLNQGTAAWSASPATES